MNPLGKGLRNQLERSVKEARTTAEDAARAALEQLGVGEATAFGHMNDEECDLRRRLRIHGRQLGDHRNAKTETQEIDRLIEEVAYEHWHRMLFARFLSENNLLMYPDPTDPVAVTLEECEDLSADEGTKNGWELAARFATLMLPQIFRVESPVFQLELPPEHQQKLERLLSDLPQDVFTASDSLGWVYQFWQAKKKDDVNNAEVKIGARELPAVTQLFTEPYMVSFLLDNSLGAWWAARRLTQEDWMAAKSEVELRQKAALPGVPLEFLRFCKVQAASSRLDSHLKSGSDRGSIRSKEIGFFHNEEPIANLTGNLPHWRQDGVTYFVTFRTADSLPQEKLKQWQDELETYLKQHPEPHDDQTRRAFYERFPERIHYWLNQGYGACLLKRKDLKTIVEDALKHFDGERYDLDEFVVMSNHVHVLVTPRNGHELSKILHSWKSFTGNEINKRTGKSGAFWQKESFDHIVRNPAQLEKVRQYIRDHPTYVDHCGHGTLLLQDEKRQGEKLQDEKRQDAACTMKIWTPAAGTFDGWPKNLRDLKTLDPCCGSGHFLVAAFLMLVPMRMELEGLSAHEAVDAVLCENIHGLELDQRCVELAAFALALTAWRYPNAGGYRKLPRLHVACSGLSVSVGKDEWQKLANGDRNLRLALGLLHDEFCHAPVLGSLLDPKKSDATKLVDWSQLETSITLAIEKERSVEEREAGVIAQGLTKAAQLMGAQYHYVMTNVPYLARGKQNETLRDFCDQHFSAAKNDLATVFLDRCLAFCVKNGTVSIVLPQNWLFLTSYRKFREKLLQNETWHLIARLGPQAFQTPMWDFNVQLITMSRGNVKEASCLFGRQEATLPFTSSPLKQQDAASTVTSTNKTKAAYSLFEPQNTPATFISGLDVSEPRTAEEKAAQLLTREIKRVEQANQLENPDARVTLDRAEESDLLSKFADSPNGMHGGDSLQFRFNFWEIADLGIWHFFQCTNAQTEHFGGKVNVFYWADNGQIHRDNPKAYVKGEHIWGKPGIAVSMMRNLPVTVYSGDKYDISCTPIVPYNPAHLPAIWCFCSSPEYNVAVRRIDQKLNVTNATLVKVPFDLEHWTNVASEKYPNGLPQPYSDDPTQWIFHGHPCASVVWDEEKKWTSYGPLRTDETVLQVAVARLLGYRWPAELDSEMELCDEARALIEKAKELWPCGDADGIVCIPSIRGEASAADRLLNLLAAAYGDVWRNDILSELLKQADHAGKTLDTWLKEKFFTYHCKLFHHRPFIWHIWDGLRDGFAVLVNYHKLDYKNLETLIYTYLGDWINRQKQDIANGVDGAEEKLSAAEVLKRRLELILTGESPCDIFVRWKPIEQQPIGWNPDLNDGVRLNIRPFLSVPDVGKKGAGVLRDKPNVKWDKDRGKDVASAPWYPLFNGDRINDHHLSLEEKRNALKVSKESRS